jgi:hypothetical protein
MDRKLQAFAGAIVNDRPSVHSVKQRQKERRRLALFFHFLEPSQRFFGRLFPEGICVHCV